VQGLGLPLSRGASGGHRDRAEDTVTGRSLHSFEEGASSVGGMRPGRQSGWTALLGLHSNLACRLDALRAE
jgi:hypothetical protein